MTIGITFDDGVNFNLTVLQAAEMLHQLATQTHALMVPHDDNESRFVTIRFTNGFKRKLTLSQAARAAAQLATQLAAVLGEV